MTTWNIVWAPRVCRLGKWLGVGISGLGATALLITTLCYLAGARINTTRSIPLGLYWVSSKTVAINDYVMFCPPQNPVIAAAKKRGYISPGLCPGGYGYLMKKILAAKNDEVTVNAKGVLVNGDLLPLSKPIVADASGNLLPTYPWGTYSLGSNQVLMMSDVNARSFDSRYFGPVDIALIKTVITPIYTW